MSLWIPAHQSLARHPKVRRAARTLGVDKAELIGRLMLLWWWALDYAPDGYIGDWDDLFDALEVDDDQDGWVDALVDNGFLDPVTDGWLIHDWDDHAGKAVNAKQARSVDGGYGNHVRWHENENRYNPDCPYCQSPDSPPDSPPDHGANRRAEKIRQEKIRQQQQGEPTTEDLYTAARSVMAERTDAGYHVDDEARFLAHLIKTEEVQHLARKQAWSRAQ